MNKAFGWGVAVMAIGVLSGCSGADEGTTESASKLIAEESEVVCHSVRDDKDYRVGEKVVGKHDVLRCPASVKVCLAPDSNYSSECKADGTWAITDNGFVSGGM